MPTASRTAHRTIADTALPYVTNSSVTSTDPQYIGGQNVMTSLRQWLERRPGFSATIEQTASTFSNLRRQFVWRKWSGAFIWMGCDVTATQSKVYKMQLGTDASAQLIFTSNSAEPFDFVISNNTCYFGNGTDMQQFDGTRTVDWGITAPASGPGISLVAGSANVYTSWCYCYTYFDSTNGGESSPSAISACSGTFSSKNVRLGVTASTQSRVTNIRIYRTPDGGAQDPTQMQEISGSPFANSTTTHDDNTADASLGLRVAPAFLRNDPPTPSKGFVPYGGRIWSFNNNTTYYSGFEEISNGVPEECWPSGLGGNFYPWPNEVTAHAPLLDGIAVFMATQIGKIEGDSLDTFRRYTLLERRGTRSRTAVTSLGGSVAWLDTSNTVWISDLGEVGLDIRPDIQSIDPTKAYVRIHISGIYHWLVLLDGANGKMFVLDLDKKRWMPPWTVGTTASALSSSETSIGVVDLLLARNTTKALKFVSGTYQDDGNAYAANVQTNMFWMSQEGNPAAEGTLSWVELKTDTVVPSLSRMTDDDPRTGTFVALNTNVGPSPDVPQGSNLLTTRYPDEQQRAQMLSLNISWPAQNSNFHLYTIDPGWHPQGA